MSDDILSRFLRYVRIDTQSQDGVEDRYPSTPGQLDLLRLLAKELKAMGASGVRMDQHGYVTAAIPSNLPKGHPARGKVPPVGFIAHVDTSDAESGKGIKPRVFKYRGGDIRFPKDRTVRIKAAGDAALRKEVGHTLITSDGTTLLGADDKAGVSVIMDLVRRLRKDSSLLHGEVKVAFTPDEEVGNGTKFFDAKAFGAKAAYTFDGYEPGQLNKETFSADSAVITVTGVETHPGEAKDVMVNSIRAMADIIARLPRKMAPETTSGYEPYIHPHDIHGSTGKTVLKFLLRDFKTAGLAKQKRILERIITEVRRRHPKAKFELKVTESYRNMRAGLEKDSRVLATLWEAVRRAGAVPRWEPIRGGTDGSRLTAQGLPTPNIFMGGGNFHSRAEWASLEGMRTASDTAVHLLRVWVEQCSQP
ncbi:MAG: peptidase T [Elusimicrobia bacterium GWA2_69_24]|nr:MAG: peptidase T [Elusimicrobia bacterium GWA2_69_24]